MMTEKTLELAAFDVERIRKDFPILQTKVHGKNFIYLDNANTTQKPKSVIDATSEFYSFFNANIHRGNYYYSELATEKFDQSRNKIRDFINARDSKEIIFTRGTTESINLVAYSFGRKFVKAGDEILISAMEHHSNIVPWQILCEEKGAKLRVIPMNDEGELILDDLDSLLNEKTKLVSIVHISNALGTINPVKLIIEKAHQKNIPVLIDGAQSIQHLPTDVQDLDCDFFAFSGHKIFGPTGIGVLYGKEKWLEQMPPFLGGGDMIKNVTLEKTIYNDLPLKFEAGTPNIAGGIVIGASVDYVNSIGLDHIQTYENELFSYASEKMKEVEGIRFIGTAKSKASVISFLLDGAHPYDTGVLLDKLGIAVRTGHHCTQPIMTRFDITGTVRASISFYNIKSEIDALVDGLNKVRKMLV